ncbi:MAG: acyl-CoA dehydrogenase [Gammaproteobacteria bacterium]|nr:acyl-CoA dehydrogenase [Gammaproteobacteria bacterium]
MTHANPAAGGEPDYAQLLSDSVADYCARALEPRRLRALHGASQSFDRQAWRDMAELGWCGLLVPEAQGGVGLGAQAVASVCRELGRVVAAEPFIESAVMAASLLSSLNGAAAHLAALLDGAAVYSAPVTPAAWQRAVQARRDGDAWLLDGELGQVPLAADADVLLMPARSEGGELLCVVPRNAAGLTVESVTLADDTRDGRVSCQALRCESCLPISAAAVARSLALGAVAGSAYMLGLCEALLDTTLEYLRTRRQFGRALGSFQALQHRAVDMFMHVRLTRAALDAAVTSIDAGQDSALAGARVRQRACDTVTRVLREAIQLHGAIGYTEQCDVSLYVQRGLVMSARHGGAITQLRGMPALLHGASADEAALPAPLPDAYLPPGGDWNEVDDRLFRSTVRHWIEANYPATLRHPPGQLRWAEIKDWHATLVARGWAAPAWPREYGGMGLGASKMIIFIEELERWGVARAPDQGIVMIGPILQAHGNQAQRERYLAHALSGDEIWCQGYSEPNAGSDLASLATSAVLEGDEFIVNGQKTWTTHGMDATHMYCLVRTDPQAKPQAGISFLLIDLQQPGVTVRPIINLGGHVDFCEVFLDNVRVPRANLVGALNQGWTIAKSLLGHERLFVGSPKLCQHALHQLRELAQADGRLHDAVFVDALARIALDVLDLEALYADYAAMLKRGEEPGVDISLLKIWSTETYVRLSEMILEAGGDAAGVRGAQRFGGTEIDVLSHFYNARPAPIYAGSNEIQRNIIAKHVLKLPT